LKTARQFSGFGNNCHLSMMAVVMAVATGGDARKYLQEGSGKEKSTINRTWW